MDNRVEIIPALKVTVRVKDHTRGLLLRDNIRRLGNPGWQISTSASNRSHLYEFYVSNISKESQQDFNVLLRKLCGKIGLETREEDVLIIS